MGKALGSSGKMSDHCPSVVVKRYLKMVSSLTVQA